jgi:hypothetical protein
MCLIAIFTVIISVSILYSTGDVASLFRRSFTDIILIYDNFFTIFYAIF